MTIRDQIFTAIEEERAAQDRKWGGPKHDDAHSLMDWIVYLREHVEKSVGPPEPGFEASPPHLQESEDFDVPDLALFNKQMVRVAALAVAALESNARDEVMSMFRAARCAKPIAKPKE